MGICPKDPVDPTLVSALVSVAFTYRHIATRHLTKRSVSSISDANCSKVYKKISLLTINFLCKNKIIQSHSAKNPKGKSYELKNACCTNTAESIDLPLDPSLLMD